MGPLRESLKCQVNTGILSWPLPRWPCLALLAPSLLGPLPDLAWPCLIGVSGHAAIGPLVMLHLPAVNVGWYLLSPPSMSKLEGLRRSEKSQSWGLRPCLPCPLPSSSELSVAET